MIFFNELESLSPYDGKQDMVLFNNKDILVGGKPVFISEGLTVIVVYLGPAEQQWWATVLPIQEFNNKYDCNTNFQGNINGHLWGAECDRKL